MGTSRGFHACRRAVLRCERLEPRIAPDAQSIGPKGIDADGTGLTGDGVHIGQVELLRPGMNPLDDAQHRHPNVQPTAVYEIDGNPRANTNVGTAHAIKVAGVMIANSTRPNFRDFGVSRKALLHSSASLTGGTEYEPELLAMQ